MCIKFNVKEQNDMRKTKIVCTIGPATKDVEVLKELMCARNGCSKNQFFSW